MERSSGWRPIEPEEHSQEVDPASAPRSDQRNDAIKTAVAAIVGAAVLVAAGVLLWAGTPQPQVVLGPGGNGPISLDEPDAPSNVQASAEAPPTQELIVDVQGAVLRPGIQRLTTGARVGDAIAAAGGYGPQVDLRATAERLNLAEHVTDGAKVYVPARGDPTPAAAGGGGPSAGGGSAPVAGDSAGGGLIDVNSAGQALLETLPGIGPVTAGKIITAREESPFATIDDLLVRKVVGPATFEKIKPLITVSP